MVNKNSKQIMMKRMMTSESLVERKELVRKSDLNKGFSNPPTESFVMSYDGEHKDFFQELITKVNEIYSGTKAEIFPGTVGGVRGNLIQRMGLVSTIANDSSLRSADLYPINATQSEYLLKEGKIINFNLLRGKIPANFKKNLSWSDLSWEDLGLVLYDRSSKGYNLKESQKLYDSLKNYRDDLGLSESDLESKLVVINPGAEIDSSMSYGVKPIIVPGITQVYRHEVLEKVGKDLWFDGYGLNGGLPLVNQLSEEGNRKLKMPNETEYIGLRMFFRNIDLSLSIRDCDLTTSGLIGKIIFAKNNLL